MFVVGALEDGVGREGLPQLVGLLLMVRSDWGVAVVA